MNATCSLEEPPLLGCVPEVPQDEQGMQCASAWEETKLGACNMFFECTSLVPPGLSTHWQKYDTLFY